jgi:hypothetical protein
MVIDIGNAVNPLDHDLSTTVDWTAEIDSQLGWNMEPGQIVCRMSKIAQLLLEGDFRIAKFFYSDKVILIPSYKLSVPCFLNSSAPLMA